MILKQLLLRNFRNYSNININFNRNITILTGITAQGKTNLLESIYMLAITKSYRTSNDSDLITYNHQFFKIQGIVENDDQITKKALEIIVTKQGKQININKKTIKRVSDYITVFNAVFFTPDSMEIIKGSPNIRRKVLNIEISQIQKKYIQYLRDYKEILKNRNNYLKKVDIGNYDKKYLQIITEQLVDKAVKIYNYRKEFIDKLNKYMNSVYGKINNKSNIYIKYETGFLSEKIKDKNFKGYLVKKYNDIIKREIMLCQTTIGPHRDDFSFYMDNKEVRTYCSQGQQRIIVLSFKLAQVELFKEITKERPVLLLDDLFSELDIAKKNQIFKTINPLVQTFITTTNLEGIEKKHLQEIDILEINEGTIIKRRGGNNEKIK